MVQWCDIGWKGGRIPGGDQWEIFALLRCGDGCILINIRDHEHTSEFCLLCSKNDVWRNQGEAGKGGEEGDLQVPGR